ncbi:MAG TPA: hypothetical protein VLY24_04800 [Bryobacteraceae bacterium]|nr:hypothetical protein [Bryobacteraceae bacterium]
MQYVALEFDHLIGQHAIRWVVLECAGVGRVCGGPIALPPRRDVAYFLDPQSAEIDAMEFTDFKNRNGASDDAVLRKVREGGEPSRHHAYPWDHHIFSGHISWACLEWSGSEQISAPRLDVAYFVHPESAESDAKAFSWLRDQRLRGKESGQVMGVSA